MSHVGIDPDSWTMTVDPPVLRETADADADLVRRAKAGEFAAFESLVTRYERPIYALARRIVGRPEDAEDAVQETFASVVEHLKEFREESSFHTWLTRIATNHALKILRKRRGLTTVPLEEDGVGDAAPLPMPDFIAPWASDPEKAGRDPSLRLKIDSALAELDEKYRLVFVLRDLHGMSTAAAAESLGITESNLKVRLLRARLQLRERLTRMLGDESARVLPPPHPKDHDDMRSDDEVR
jgi:RNA polymerase sigma-70 factor (ECF subfamily)